MTLKQQLTEDMKAAMKGGDKHSLGVIRLVNAAIKQREVDERIELDDAAVLAVLEKMVKQRKDSVTQYAGAGREDLAQIERDEIKRFFLARRMQRKFYLFVELFERRMILRDLDRDAFAL